MLGQIISIIFGFFYNIYTARYLGAEGFGVLSFALAFTGIFGLLGDLGLSTLAIREVARDKSLSSKYLGNITSIKLFLVIITFGVIGISINILDYPQQTINVVYIIAASTLLTNLTQIFSSMFQAYEKLEYLSIGRVINGVLMLIGAFIAIKQNLSIVSFVSIYLFVNGIVLLYSICICSWKFVLPTLRIDFIFWKKIIKESLPFWLTSVFVIIYFRIDMVMLSLMKGDVVVGWYAASYRLIDALSFIPSVFMSVMYPVFSRYHVNSKKSLELSFEKSYRFLIIIAIPIGIGTTLLAEEIINLVYGDEYIPSVIALQILIWASVLSFINYTPATFLNSTNNQRKLMIFTSYGALLNIILNFVLIPSLSYSGAGIATVITEFVVGILMISQIRKVQNISSLLSGIIKKSLIAGSIMGVFIIMFKSYSIFVLIIPASIIYFIVLFIVRGLEKEDLNLLNQMFEG
jgi:O-antigen/teichoic acid export membrane protein